MNQFGLLEQEKTATSEDANNAIKSIRDKICQIYGQNVGKKYYNTIWRKR